MEAVYRPALRSALQARYVVLSIFVTTLIVISSLVVSGWIPTKFFPDVEVDVATARLTLPNGVPFEVTREAIAEIEEKAFELNEHFQDRDGNPIIRHMLASAGTQPFQAGFARVEGTPTDANLGEVTLELQPAANRNYSGPEIVSKWRELTGDIPGAVELSSSSAGPAGGNAIDLKISGPDLAQLEGATEEIKAVLRSYDGVIDIADSNLEGKRELKLAILPGAEALGLRLEDVARQVRQDSTGTKCSACSGGGTR